MDWSKINIKIVKNTIDENERTHLYFKCECNCDFKNKEQLFITFVDLAEVEGEKNIYDIGFNKIKQQIINWYNENDEVIEYTPPEEEVEQEEVKEEELQE